MVLNQGWSGKTDGIEFSFRRFEEQKDSNKLVRRENKMAGAHNAPNFIIQENLKEKEKQIVRNKSLAE